MKPHRVCTLAAMVFLGACSAQDSNQSAAANMRPETPWTLEEVPIAPSVAMANRYPEAKVEFPGGVVGMPDLVFGQPYGYRPLTLDMYLPPDTGTPRSMVLYIHGGGWQGGHSRQSGAFDNWPGTLAMIASRGFVVTSINYRLGGEEPFPAAIHDIKLALRWLRANADRYNIDKDRFLVWGASAGGLLAALAGTTCGVAALEPLDMSEALAAESDCVQATIDWYGIFDLKDMGEGGGPGGYFAGQTEAASPVTHVNENTGPFLLIHGSIDQVIDYQQSVDFHALLQEKGVPSTLHIIPDVAHSFIGATPESTRSASLEALGLSIAFMENVLK